jgi:hypothetical protein
LEMRVWNACCGLVVVRAGFAKGIHVIRFLELISLRKK